MLLSVVARKVIKISNRAGYFDDRRNPGCDCRPRRGQRCPLGAPIVDVRIASTENYAGLTAVNYRRRTPCCPALVKAHARSRDARRTARQHGLHPGPVDVLPAQDDGSGPCSRSRSFNKAARAAAPRLLRSCGWWYK